MCLAIVFTPSTATVTALPPLSPSRLHNRSSVCGGEKKLRMLSFRVDNTRSLGLVELVHQPASQHTAHSPSESDGNTAGWLETVSASIAHFVVVQRCLEISAVAYPLASPSILRCGGWSPSVMLIRHQQHIRQWNMANENNSWTVFIRILNVYAVWKFQSFRWVEMLLEAFIYLIRTGIIAKFRFFGNQRYSHQNIPWHFPRLNFQFCAKLKMSCQLDEWQKTVFIGPRWHDPPLSHLLALVVAFTVFECRWRRWWKKRRNIYVPFLCCFIRSFSFQELPRGNYFIPQNR